MNKIYLNGNYVIIQPTGLIIDPIPTNLLRYKESNLSFTLTDGTNIYSGLDVLTILFADAGTWENDLAVAYTESTLRTFLTNNTSYTSAGVASELTGNTISAANSTSTLLTSGETFTGAWEEVTDFNVVRSAVLTDNSTDGILYFDVSMDGGVEFISIPRAISDTTFNFPHKIAVIESYIRIRYVNGTTAQTGFLNIQTTYAVDDTLDLSYRLDDSLDDANETTLTRSVLVGRDNDGTYRNVPVDEEGQLAVNVHDQKTRSIDFFFGRLDNLTTLSANADPEDMTLTLTDTTGFTDGKVVGVFSLNEVDDFYLGGQIGAPSGSVITVDTPVDVPLASGSAIAATTINMAVDGSSVTQVFQIGPVAAGSTSVVDVTRIMGHILDSTAMDDGKFGGISALTNGVVLRKNDGLITNLWNVKTNADLALICYDFKYSDKAPGGQFGANFRNSYAGQGNHGVVLELLPTEYLEILIQDDLTGLDEFTMMAQGHFKF